MTCSRTVTILGATGSIGRSATDLLARNRDRFRVEAVAAGHDAQALARVARDLDARFAAIADESAYRALQEALTGTGIETAAGPEAVIAAAERGADIVIGAIVGIAGLDPVLAAAKAGAVLALANKEALVCAGPILLEAARKAGTRILPVDSEHNAIFQVFEEANRSHIRRLVLTASGGPFRDWDAARTARATPADAVRHPNWSMGAKISVDSATLMNKGLEVIEAHHLFAMDEDRIEVVVHPQSVVHSFVDYADGSMLAQLGAPDMRTALSVCLAWPERMQAPVPPLDLLSCGNLTFEAPDTRRFPALDLARDALRAGGTAPVILNGANEVAVQSFLDGTLVFPDISSVIAETMSRVPSMPLTDIETVRDADCRARIVARDVMSRLSRS